MRNPAQKAKDRPAEAATAGAGGIAVLIAAIVGVDSTAAALMLAAVGTVPAVITFMVKTVRTGTQTSVLVGLTPKVAEAAGKVLDGARDAGWKEQAEALGSVADAVSKWSDLLEVEPASGPPKG